MNRMQLRRILNNGGVRTGRKDDGATATIVEFVDWWGVMPGVPGTGSDTPCIRRALDQAGVTWRMGNMPLVPKAAS